MVTQPPGALSDIHDRAPIVLGIGNEADDFDLVADVDDLLTAAPANMFTVQRSRLNPEKACLQNIK